jgi:hypothetical protein
MVTGLGAVFTTLLFLTNEANRPESHITLDLKVLPGTSAPAYWDHSLVT